VDPGELERATAEYLKLPWMQLDLIDWYLLNAFVFDAIARLQDEALSGSVLGRINWSYILAEGRIHKLLLYRFGFGLLAFCVRWLLLPAAIVYLLYRGRNDLLPWIAAPYGVYVLYRLATLPARILRRRQEKSVLAGIDTTLKQMIAAYQTATARTFNPTRLQEQVRLAEGPATYFRPAVHSVLARIIERDASVFSV